jgi:hypothetical protein
MRLTAEQDKALEFGVQFVNLRPRDLQDLTGRSIYVCRRTFRQLVIERRVRFGDKKGTEKQGLGLFYCLPNPSNPFERVFFPTQKGWDEAYKRGYVNHEVNANREKSDDQLDHDLILTDLHKALLAVYGPENLRWSQLWQSRYTRWGKKPEQYINADAFFALRQPNGTWIAFFVEVENQKGVQEPLRKMAAYVAFAQSGAYQEKFEHPDFRAIFLKPSREMTLNLLAAASKDRLANTKRFLCTDYDAIPQLTQKVFGTPKDFRERTWGFSDLQ